MVSPAATRGRDRFDGGRRSLARRNVVTSAGLRAAL